MSTPPSICIIVLNWNSPQDTLACLDSLLKIPYRAKEILVVDNGSTDESVCIIKSSFPQVKLLETGKNMGFVGGNNAGMTYALEEGFDYTLVLNNDTVVNPDFLERLLEVAESDDQIGAVGPKINYFSKPDVIWSAGGIIDYRHGTTEMKGIGQTDQDQYGRMPYQVDFLTGCAILVKRQTLQKIGLLDPRFFMYYEDVEWCVRMTKAGCKIQLVPESIMWHKISPEVRADSPLVYYYMTRNRLLFLKESKLGWKPWVYTLFVDDFRTMISWTLKPRWKNRRFLRKFITMGIYDAFKGNWGKKENIDWKKAAQGL
jgi:GT2 family glycosyltransferase